MRIPLRYADVLNRIVLKTMQNGLVKDVTTSTAMKAAIIGLQQNLPMADSLILATANVYNALCGLKILILRIYRR